MTEISLLNQPLCLPCGAEIKNRLGKSAMSEALGQRSGAPKPELANLYRQWAAGGIGLSITGNVMIDKRALGEPGNVVIESDEHLDALRAWAAAATQNGTACWVQLNHPGKQAPKGLNKENVAPSAVPFREDMQKFFATPRELTAAEIEEIIARFGRAAGVVKAAGFSGVQIHGAHGYLVSQFLSPHHNRRTDQWGGSAENRRRFVLAVYRAMREAVGADFPIGIKLNSADFQKGGFSEEESLQVLQALEEAGIDLIEISGGTYEAPVMSVGAGGQPVKESTRRREAYFMAFAEKARQSVKVPLMLTGGFRSAEGMADAVADGAVDMVGLARLLAIEPNAPQCILQGLNPQQTVVPRKTGIKALDSSGLMEIKWYLYQMKRLAHNQPVNPKKSDLMLFLGDLFKQLKAGRKAKIQRQRARD